MKRFMKISTLVLALCSLFSFTSNDHGVKSVKAAKGAGDENWGLVGSFTDQITGTKLNWDQDEYDDIKFKYVSSTDSEPSRYELAYSFKAKDEFKIRLDNKWDVEIGYSGNEGGNISTYLSNSNGNFKVKEDGTYLLKVVDDNVANYGDKYYGFSIEKITTATFDVRNIGFRKLDTNESAEVTDDMIKSIVITNKTTEMDNRKDKLKYVYKVVGSDADTSTDTSPDNYLRAYIYSTESADLYDCVIYANVDIIYANPDSSGMFANFKSLTNITFECFDTSNVTDMSSMFSFCKSLLSLDLSSFNTSNVTDMSEMFNECNVIKEIKFYDDPTNHTFDTSKVTDMYLMFCRCRAIESIDISGLNTTNVENMYYMFCDCEAAKSINLPKVFCTEKNRYCAAMFGNCHSLESIDLSGFDTRNVIDMQIMFAMCTNLKSIDVSKFNTKNVQNMDGMFGYCSGLTTLDLSNFETPNLTQMIGMFAFCTNLEQLDISNFNLSNISLEAENRQPIGQQWAIMPGVEYLFMDDSNLKYIKTPTAIKEGLSANLPTQYANVEGGVKAMDNTTVNMTLVPGSLELNKLYNDICKLDTCSEYSNATALRERYDALSEADKTIFADLSLIDQDKNGNNISLLANDKLAYMEYMLTLNSETEKNNIHIMTTINDNPSFLVVATIISSLAILGYYMIQKRKSSID